MHTPADLMRKSSEYDPLQTNRRPYWVAQIQRRRFSQPPLTLQHGAPQNEEMRKRQASLASGCFIANADGSIVVATYGTISSDTGNMSSGSWLIVTFMLAVCAVQPTYGKLGDLYGRKSMLIVAYSLFTIGCALCGAGQTLWQVVLGRGIAGLGGAGMTSLVSVLIADKVPLRDVATWRSYVNIASTVGRSAGGPIGGFLADKIVAWKLDGTPVPIVTVEGPKTTTRGKLGRIDFLGSISLALTIVGFLLILDIGGQKLPWGHSLIWIIFAAASVSSIAFVLIEAFVAREPIFPLRLLVHRDVILAYLVICLLGAAQFGVMYTVPLYFQVTARVSVTNAGFHLFPAVCGNAIGGLLSGIIIKRSASYKALTVMGTLSSISCYTLLTFFWHGGTNIWQSLFIAPGGFGMGIVLSTTFVYLAAGVGESEMAIASTGLYLSNNIGTLVGASLTSNILQTTLRSGLESGLDGWAERNTIIRKALSDLEYVKQIDGHLRDVVVDSYIKGFRYTYSESPFRSSLAISLHLTGALYSSIGYEIWSGALFARFETVTNNHQ
ncbi:MAG: hypothetical protein Q9223_001656 [Gallowayella weberi]